MGTWSTGVFENDDALDWLQELSDTSSIFVLNVTLQEAKAEYLEAPAGARILGACELIAAVMSEPAAGLPDAARDWVRHQSAADVATMIPSALGAVDRVLGEGSELSELWRENESEYAAWRQCLLDLKTRLAS